MNGHFRAYIFSKQCKLSIIVYDQTIRWLQIFIESFPALRFVGYTADQEFHRPRAVFESFFQLPIAFRQFGGRLQQCCRRDIQRPCEMEQRVERWRKLNLLSLQIAQDSFTQLGA